MLKIGQGSFATVKRCIHRSTGHFVAMKIYEKKNIKDEEMSTALRREIYILAALNHPNIVSLYEVINSRTHV